MTHEIIIAGFGGQGVLSMGKILAYAGLLEGKEVSWMPSYGPEQRGGTANVTVILSDKAISSPIVTSYDVVIVLNQPSFERFANAVKPGGGIVLYDGYGVCPVASGIKARTFRIEATNEALSMGNGKLFNMIVLGGLLELLPLVSLASVMAGLKKSLPERHHHLLEQNEAALRRGMATVTEIN
jgi:2-oxoglutarate ferredoxin oxidoreductase subunit gamma